MDGPGCGRSPRFKLLSWVTYAQSFTSPCLSLSTCTAKDGGASELTEKWDGRQMQVHGGHVERMWRGQGVECGGLQRGMGTQRDLGMWHPYR